MPNGIEFGEPPAVQWPVQPPERPERADPESWLSSRMFQIRRRARSEWQTRGEIEPWDAYFQANFPDVAAFYAKRQYTRYGEDEEWKTWFARRYPSLARQFGYEQVSYVAGKGFDGYYPQSTVEKLKRMRVSTPEMRAQQTWADWLRGARGYTPRIQTLGF